MKNILFILCAVFCLSSCEAFLDLSPDSQPNANDFYKTENDFNGAVIACYQTLRSYPTMVLDVLEYRSDNMFMPSFTSGSQDKYEINHFQDNKTNSLIADIWKNSYSAISRCNVMVDRIQGAGINADKKIQFESEARFIRAFHYFNLVRLFGKVPLVIHEITDEEALKTPREDINNVYEQIITDLNFALQLPGSYDDSDLGRVTAKAAEALLAKVYLTNGKYAEAKVSLGNIITNGKYDLLTDIKDVFDVNNEMNKEILFAVKYSKSLIDGGHGMWLSLSDVTLAHFSSVLKEAYNANDKRAELIQYKKSGSTYLPVKFYDTQDASTNQVGNDFIILRYSDVLLMYAEVLNELNFNTDITSKESGFYYLNKVRNRAGLPALSSVEVPSQEEFKKAILRERYLEFPLEGNRWFDLVRTGSVKKAIKSAYDIDVPDFRFIFPIPSAEVEKVNNPDILPQNPEY
ncbi:MAG: RagB/SusD family nutrient uptake outer membrane protein [Bacteroides oleiciplenus]|nr:RagB/SusD family nutrient uptake outer membrane protein [Bacteroides oleiciplenus]